MLIIRLARFGRKKQPSYRVIINEKSKDTRGDYLEQLGNYNPRTKPKTIQFNTERIQYWLSKGAQASDTVHNLLVAQGIIKGDKIRKGRTKKKLTAEEMAQQEAAAKAETQKKAEAKAKTEAEAQAAPVAEAAPAAAPAEAKPAEAEKKE